MAEKIKSGELLSHLLASEGPLGSDYAISLLHQLANQLEALHDRGRLHRSISADHVIVDGKDHATLVVSEGTTSRQEADFVLPPELQEVSLPSLPDEIEAARVVLQAAGLDLDPRRVDIYQLGCLACEMLTGDAPQAYLFSPRAKARVPQPWRRLIDRALGYDPARRISNCDEFKSRLAEISDLQLAKPIANTPPRGTGADVMTNTPREPHAAAPEPVQSSAAGAPPFTNLGPYRVVAWLGSGGMGDVYQGYEPALERAVAIKVLPAALARHQDFVRRFVEEAKAAARLVHPNIVQIYTIGEDQGHHYFVMQFVQGETLAALMARERRLPFSDALAIIEQVLSGLSAAHRQGMIHRDIKPGNILLDAQHDRGLLADFGLVKSLGSSAQMTATGMVMGTVDYISPEQGRGKPVDVRSDLYSVGVLMYQMLSGQLPFVADSPTAMIFQHAYEQPRPLGEVMADIPSGLVAVVHRLMAKDPAGRYQTADELLADVRAIRASPDFPPRAVAAERAADRSVIIAVPEFDFADKERWLTKALARPRIRLQDRVRALFHLHAPAALKSLQNTQQQVEGALAVYETRREKLAQLAHEARAVERDLAEQNLTAHLAEQRAEREKIELRLAQADAALQKLRSQQVILRARLQTAKARAEMEGGINRNSRSMRRVPRWLAWVVFGVVILASGLLWRLGSPLPNYSRRSANGIGEVSAIALPISGRFFVTCKGSSEVYLNGKEIVRSTENSHPAESRPLILHQGDILDIHVRSEFVRRAFRIAFVSEDRRWIWAARYKDFRVLGDDAPDKVDAAQIAKITKIPSRGRVDGPTQDEWNHFNLPNLVGDWMWVGRKNDWGRFAAVIEPSLFSSTENLPQSRPSPDVATASSNGDLPMVPRPHDSSSYEEAVLADRPVAYWRLNEASDSSTARNLGTEGEVLQGTYTNVDLEQPSAFAALGTAADFSASSRVTLANNLGAWLNGTATFEIWIKTTQSSAKAGWDSPAVTGADSNGDGLDVYWGTNTGGRIGVRRGDGNIDAAALTPEPINDGAWHHVVMTRNHATGVMQTYLDGSPSPVATFDDHDGLEINTEYNRLGFLPPTAGTPEKMIASLDEVAIYDYVLSPARVEAHYAARGTSVSEQPANQLRPWIRAEPLQVSWITQYCNESIQTVDLSKPPRMLRNISNSLMTAAPSYLDKSIYLQRRTNLDVCPELAGIGEIAQDWLRPNRISLSKPAVVVAAVREDHYPGAGELLTSLGWRRLPETVTLEYYAGHARLSLYAGLVAEGPTQISGAGVDQLRSGGDPNTSPHYFFVQEAAAFSPETFAQFQVVQ